MKLVLSEIVQQRIVPARVTLPHDSSKFVAAARGWPFV